MSEAAPTAEGGFTNYHAERRGHDGGGPQAGAPAEAAATADAARRPGHGKTTLVKGIAEALDAAEADEVTSPTFTLIHEYDGTRDGQAGQAVPPGRVPASIFLNQFGVEKPNFKLNQKSQASLF